MTAYGPVLIDIDLGIGRQYGYRDPARAELIEQCRPLPPGVRAATCHPDRAMHAKGKCGTCYRRDWRNSK